jgi:hypothetical protein
MGAGRKQRYQRRQLHPGLAEKRGPNFKRKIAREQNETE